MNKKIEKFLMSKIIFISNFNDTWVMNQLSQKLQNHPMLENYKMKPFYGWINKNEFRLRTNPETLLGFHFKIIKAPIFRGKIVKRSKGSNIEIIYYDRFIIGWLLFIVLLFLSALMNNFSILGIVTFLYIIYLIGFLSELSNLKEKFKEFFETEIKESE